MFDSLLKTKFYAKCKSATKRSKTRINMIKRRRNTMQKYLKNDITDLLRHGLLINAYGRSEGLLVEMSLSACYALLEQFCKCTTDNLSLMSKQRECPHECKEAVSSLIYAAARFADLPELRVLRSAFTDRYGSSLEVHVNKEFIEKLKAMPPTKDMKFQLLQEISLESGINWDSKALEQKLYHPTSEQDWHEVEDDGNSKLNKTKHGSIVSESKKDQINSEMNIDNGSLKEVYYQFIPQVKEEARVKDPTKEHSLALETKPKPKSVRKRRWKLIENESNDNVDEVTKDGESEKIILNNNNNNNTDTCVDEEKCFLRPLPDPLQQARITMNIRIDSLEPEMMSPTMTGHVHPNLPDYDAFVARLTTLKGGDTYCSIKLVI